MNLRADQIADVGDERRSLRRQRAKDEFAKSLDAQLFEPVLFEPKACRHAAAPGDAAAKGDAFEVAGEVVAPSVIDAGQVLGMAAPLQADEIAAMGAAIDHRMDLAVLAAGDHDRRLAQESRQVIARLRQLAGERQILPSRPEKDAGELRAVNLGI